MMVQAFEPFLFLKAARCPANGVVILNHNVTAQSYYLKRMIASAVGNVLMLAHNRLFPLLMPGFINRDRCIQCGKCTEICPTRALEMKGKRMSVTAVMRELEKEENLYRRSGGGITLSGGEPLAQPEFARELLKACKAKGWHTAIETSGFTTKAVIDEVFPYVDLALTDIKAIDPEIHERNTGVNNRVILENLLRISFLTKVVVRIPVIPGVNDNSQEIHNIAEFARLMQNVDTIHLLPYHSFGENKYNLLGRQYPMGDTKSIEEAQMAELKAMVESLGFNCHIGG